MRAVIVITLCLASGLAAATNYRDVQRAVADDRMLETAGVTPADAKIREQCSAAVVSTDDPPNFFDCVYVQTDKDLNLFSLEDGYLMSELQLTLHNMDGVALQHMGRYSQVQIFSGDRVTALYIHGKSWIDPEATENVYQWLTGHGVPTRQPRKWIGPEPYLNAALDSRAIAPRMRALMNLNYLHIQFTHAFAAPPRGRDREHLIC